MLHETQNEVKPLSLQLDEQNTNSTDSKPSFERKDIALTPFSKIYQEGKGWFLVMGDNRLTEPVEDEKVLDKLVKSKDWGLMTTIIAVITQRVIKTINEEK